MKLIITLFIIAIYLGISQENYSQDNGQNGGSYTNNNMWEETCYLKPNVPAKLKKLYVYLVGNQGNLDTIRIIGDPTDGEIPGTWWVSGFLRYNTFAEFVFTMGEPGWYEFDVENLNLDIGGINRVGVQHIIKPGGPYFAIDNNGLNFNSSYLNNVFAPNPDFFNIAGTIVSFAQGDYIVRAEVEWKYPGENDAQMPDPLMVDITESAGLIVDGAGVRSNDASVIDYNNDSFDDVFVGGHLFINDANGGFEKIDVGLSGSKMTWGDLDNDGFLDAYSATGNDNDKIFWGSADGMIEQTPEVFAQDFPTMSPIFFDMDKDGDLDIYVAHNRRTVNNQEVYYLDQVYENIGNREFTNATSKAGIGIGESPPRDCYGANIVDFNNDGNPDIFVASYRLAPDQLYIGNGEGLFVDVGEMTGVRGVPTADSRYFGHGMGSDWGDFNNDGFMDLAVGNLGHPDSRGAVSNPSLIFRNNGDDSFTSVTREMGLKFFEMNSGCTWVDFNNDGLLDLWQNQYSYERINTQGRRNNYSRMYMNTGEENNYRLTDVTMDYGALIHGAWTAMRIDYDNDGDYDLLVSSVQEHTKLFRNDLNKGNNYLKVRLKGDDRKGVNLNAYGSSVKVTTDKGTYTKQLMGTQNHGQTSQSSDVIIFGLADATQINEVEVTFSNGTVETLNDVELNSSIVISLQDDVELATPKTIYPENNQVIEDGKLNLNWQNLETADSYTVRVSNSPEFLEPLIEETINFENNSFLSVDLAEGVYYWQVKASNSLGESEWSDVMSFEIGEINSVEENDIVSGINISPFPIQDISNVSIILKKANIPNISIVDINGQSLQSISDFINTGSEITFSLDSKYFANGIYFIKIETDAGTLFKKFILQK